MKNWVRYAIVAAIAALWAWGASNAHAHTVAPAQNPSEYTCVIGGYNHSGYGSLETCVADYIAAQPTGPFGCAAGSSATYSVANRVPTGSPESGGSFDIWFDVTPNPQCTDGVWASGSYSITAYTDSCPADHHLDGGSCVDDVTCTSGAAVSSGVYDFGAVGPDQLDYTTGPASTCSGGCGATFQSEGFSRRVVNGVARYFWSGSYVSTSEPCEAGETTPGTTTPPSQDTCDSATQTAGTINGKLVCFSKATGQPTNPDAGTSGRTTTTTWTDNGDGTTTRTTTNPDGSKDIVKTDSEGREIERRTEDADPTKGFCDRNPDQPSCRKSSFSGSCAVGFQCDGDAAQCAIAREIHVRDCTLFEVETTESTLGRSAVAGTDAGNTDNPALAANRETRSVGTLDQTAFLSAGSLVDVEYSIGTFAGQSYSVTVPYSMLVTLLSWLGVVAVGLTLVWAARFVLS